VDELSQVSFRPRRYGRRPLTFSATMQTPNTTIQTETLMSGRQYDRMMPVAVRLFGKTMTYLKK